MRHTLVPFVSAIAVALLAGCSSHPVRVIDNNVTQTQAAADHLLAELRAGTNAPGRFAVIDDSDYTPSRPQRIERPNPVPRCEIEYRPVGPVSLMEVEQQITRDCGVQVRITSDAHEYVANRGGDGRQQQQAQASVPAPLMVPPLVGGGSTASLPSYIAAPNQVSISYKGDVSGLLNAVTSRLGLSWRYTNGVVVIFNLDTRIYQIHSIPSAVSMNSTITSGSTTSTGVSGGGGAGGGASSSGGVSGNSGSNQSTVVTTESNPVADLTAQIESLLTPNRGRASYARSNSTITVTDTPDVLDRIELLVDTLNRALRIQVMLNIKVMSVQVSNSNEVGINWNLIYSNLANQYGLGLVNGTAGSQDAISGSLSILEGSSRFSGSALLVNALAQHGQLSVITEPTVTTLNMEPVPVQVADMTSYVARTQTLLTGGAGDFAQVSRDLGQITTGFSMNVLPHVLPDEETVLLELSIQMSDLKQLRSIGDADNLVEGPDFGNRSFRSKTRLRSGQTLVLSGYDQQINRNDRRGVGNARNWLFGGGRNASANREIIVILITPQVMG